LGFTFDLALQPNNLVRAMVPVGTPTEISVIVQDSSHLIVDANQDLINADPVNLIVTDLDDPGVNVAGSSVSISNGNAYLTLSSALDPNPDYVLTANPGSLTSYNSNSNIQYLTANFSINAPFSCADIIDIAPSECEALANLYNQTD
jgi:hypothetical protein